MTVLEEEDAWFLHVLGGRRFGPLTIEEIRGYFTSGMVRAHDRVTGPGLAGPAPATEVAELLQVCAPVEAMPPGVPERSASDDGALTAAGRRPPAPLPAAALPMQVGAPGLGWRRALLWMAVLFGVQMFSLPMGVEGATSSLRAFVAAVLLRYLAVAAACGLAAVLLNRLVRGKDAFVKDALLAMTLVHVVLLGNRFVRPPAETPAATQDVAGQASMREQLSVIRTLVREMDGTTLPAPLATHPVAAAEKKRDWFGQGKALGQQGNWEGVLKHGTEWAIAEPDEPAAWGMQGFAYDNLQQPHQAIKVYRHALSLDPASHVIWDNLGGVYEDLGQHQDAANAHNKALQIEPRYASAWNNMAIVHLRTGQGSAAVEAFRKAVEIDPGFVKAWNNLGLVYLHLDRPAEAIATYRKVLEISPGNADAVSGLNDAIERERRLAR